MKRHAPTNVPASVRGRLQNQARQTKQEFQRLLGQYATERLLYRLTISPHARRFVLKGARLFRLWTGEEHRPTRDVDFLGFGSPELNDLIQVFREICGQRVSEDDGLIFPLDEITGDTAREKQEYQGASLSINAYLDGARIPLKIDFGFGDTITPEAEVTELPALLGFPSPKLQTYPKETVVAEKLQAMVSLDISNSRMKDFYDLWYLSRRFDFDGRTLSQAIRATFTRRRTAIPNDLPLALTSEFAEDEDKRRQWAAFVRKSNLVGNGTVLPDVIAALAVFLLPPMQAAAADTPLEATWNHSGSSWMPQ